ncbi:MAG: hypothetical protein GY725_26525 [bacterium]|nr:hypothetical protein [bacterium]
MRGWKTGYTRKVFHFLILVNAAVVQAFWGLSVLFVFGAATSLVVFFALLQGEGGLLYEAIARESDRPHRSRFVLVPYFATLLGGLLSNLFFGPSAIAGYLVTGLADAIAEPVGTRFGRHRYRVPSFGGLEAQRSIEGSLAVFVASVAALALAAWLGPELLAGLKPAAWFGALVGIACLCTLVEAVSPHGWDNASLQLVASGTFWILSGTGSFGSP